MFIKNAFRLVLVIFCIAYFNANAALTTPKLGTKSAEIGTFDGWTGWIGWEGSYSDTYEPIKEKFSWAIYFAPEAIYAALLPSQAVYSGVDVNMGIKYFYGFLRAPGGASTIRGDYVSSLWSVSFSVGTMDWSPPIGILSQFSMGFEVEEGLFRVENTRTILPGIQYGAGFSASYSLLPIQLPFCVELDHKWDPASEEPAASLFWPIVIWNRPAMPGTHPLDQLKTGLQQLAQNTGVPATAWLMAGRLAPFMDRISANQDLRGFISNPSGNSSISQKMSATETWLVTSDTANLPQALKPSQPYTEVSETVKPLLGSVQLGFETGYRVGAQANTNNRTMYVDGVITNTFYPGEKGTLRVTTSEVLAVVSNRLASEFEGAWIGFDVPIESFTSYDKVGTLEWVQIKNGVASFTLAQSLSTPQVIGVLYDDDDKKPLNGGRNIELKRRFVVFSELSDNNTNNIPDFWEKQYGLTNSTVSTDFDRDGLTDYQEYIADTNPTNAATRLKIEIPTDTRNELILPFTSSVRKYVIEANTNSLGLPASWRPLIDFIGEDSAISIDLSDVIREPKAFFRLKILKP